MYSRIQTEIFCNKYVPYNHTKKNDKYEELIGKKTINYVLKLKIIHLTLRAF